MIRYFKVQPIDWRNVLFFSIFFNICALSAYMQLTTSMNIDACNALNESKLLFSGGKYFYNFYETTPPMFLYLNFPIVEAIKYFPLINFFVIFFSYYLLLALVSIWLCSKLINEIADDNEKGIKIIFIDLYKFSEFPSINIDPINISHYKPLWGS